MIKLNDIVKVGKGHSHWQVKNITPAGDALLVAMSKSIDGQSFERMRYIPGRQSRKVVNVNRLTYVAG